MQTNSKKWFIFVISLTIICLVGISLITIIIDPFFHYHKPLDSLEYELLRDNERYQNDGILRHWDYDTIITGTSMTENFKASECDEIFGGTTVKVPFAGSLLKETGDVLKRALQYNPNVRTVIRSMDVSTLLEDKDATKDIYDYAEYLTNKNPFDDVKYILNKEVIAFCHSTIHYTKYGNKTTTFDEYANWMEIYKDWFGQAFAANSYTLGEPVTEEKIITQEEIQMVRDNIQQNVVDVALAHPDVTFYVFIPPYSLGHWEQLDNQGEINYMIDAQQIAIETILPCANIKLFSFDTNFDLVCNWDNYTNYVHYGDWVNSDLLEWMKNEEYLLTSNNYEEYLAQIREFYNNYDYSSIEHITY